MNVVLAAIKGSRARAVEAEIAVLRLWHAGGVGVVDEGRAPVAGHVLQDVAIEPVAAQILDRLVHAAGQGQFALAQHKRAVGAQIVGEIVERTGIDPVERGRRDQAVAVQRAQVGDHLARLGAGGITERSRPRAKRGRQGRRRINGGDQIARRAARDFREACLFGDRPTGDGELRFNADRRDLRIHALAERDRGGIVVAVEGDNIRNVARQHRIAPQVEIRKVRIDRLVVGAGDAHRPRQILRRSVVEIFGRQADIAVIAELLGDVELHLAALIGVVADMARPFARTVESADMEAQRVADLGAIIEINALRVIADAAGELDCAAFDVAGLGDQVDHAAGRIRREGRGRTTADRLDRCQVEIGADEDVRRDVEEVAEFEDGQAVFLDLHEFGAARCQRQAADRVAGIAVAGRGFGADARNVAQDVGKGACAQLLDVVTA